MRKFKELRDFDSFYDLLEYFQTEEQCVDYLAQLRWNGSPQCPYCAHETSYVINTSKRGKRWKCAECRKQYSVRIGTIFEESKIPLRKWFFAIYLITAHKKGISSHQLARDLRLTQKTAWFILQRVRHSFQPKDVKFGGEVEADETWYGGKEKNKHKSKRVKGTQGRSVKTKTPILGVIQRDGKIYAIPVKNTKSETLLPIMRGLVDPGSKIYTDELGSYKALGFDYEHSYVKHAAEQFVDGEVHTQNIESFWALLKRGLNGIYHHVSKKHLAKYVNEFTFRFNNRYLSDGSRFDVLLANTKGRLDYETLIKEKKRRTPKKK